MAYNNRYVASIRAGGKVLKDFQHKGDERAVYIPNNTEYEILLKNLTGTRCGVSILIDGSDALGGKHFLLNPGDTQHIERFVPTDDLSSPGSKFKAVHADSGDGGIDPSNKDNGLIEIRFFREDTGRSLTYVTMDHMIPDYGPIIGDSSDGRGALQSYQAYCATSAGSPCGEEAAMNFCRGSSAGGQHVNGPEKTFGKIGGRKAKKMATAEGGKSNQSFTLADVPLETSASGVVKLRLLSTETTPITKKTRFHCRHCGQWGIRPQDRFCCYCGGKNPGVLTQGTAVV